MCGIAGILSRDGSPVEERLLRAMSEAVAHRGPDGDGIWIAEDGQVGLAHRRLSIIDLSSAAAQPMAGADGRFVITYNGEIYNHRELRRELEAAGVRDWRTDHSDTEVILAAWARWGTACLPRLRGMFAFALWDRRERSLFLVRDRIGIKPLYYALDARRLAFGSEIKAILADRTRARAVDETAFFHFLSFMTTPAPMTLFAGIAKLPAGSWLRIDADGRVEERRWWDALDHDEPLLPASDGACAEALLATLRDAVRCHKVADVPQGVFLSGGIDSSTNVKLFSEGEAEPARTFVIGYEGTSVGDELPWARLMADAVGADHHERRLVERDLLDFLPKMVRLQDEPIADPVCVPVYYVAELARRHGVKACQVGEGADELFFGYPGWKAMLQLERANALPVPAFVKSAGVALLERAGRGERTYTEILRRAGAGQALFWGGAEAFPETMKRGLLSPRLRAHFADRSSWEVLAPIRARFAERAAEPSPLNWMTYLDLNLRLPELLLMRVDKMTMGVALESRVPFLDHHVVELAMRMPSAVKTRALKHVLKRAVRGLLPDAILERPKQGFSVPVREWFLGRLGAEMRARLDRFCARTDFLDPAAVRRLLDQGRAPQAWYLFNFALWHEEFLAA
jgi:asparagine synthase (glutamine-hydrolysing)